MLSERSWGSTSGDEVCEARLSMCALRREIEGIAVWRSLCRRVLWSRSVAFSDFSVEFAARRDATSSSADARRCFARLKLFC